MGNNNTLELNMPTQSGKKLKAIFFDMDGVLFNSMYTHAKVWKEVFEGYGIHITDQEPFLNEGATACQFAQHIFQKYRGIEISHEEAEKVKNIKHSMMSDSKEIGVVDQMPNFVREVHANGVECWVVTGSGQKTLLDRLLSEYAPALSSEQMITANDVKIGKPAPEPYLKALHKSGFTAEETIVIENAPMGIQSAKSAGIFTVAINTGPLDAKLLEESGADMVFDNAIELREKWNEVLIKFANNH